MTRADEMLVVRLHLHEALDGVSRAIRMFPKDRELRTVRDTLIEKLDVARSAYLSALVDLEEEKDRSVATGR
jgi:hypothetical protein